MATYSYILTWEIPWTEDPGEIWSMGSKEVRHNFSTNNTYICIYTYFIYIYTHTWASLAAQLVKNRPAVQETWVQSLDLEDPLEEGMATHSSIRA